MQGFIGEVRMFAGNFAPQGWAFCEGQLMPISQNTALFSILGTTYGGNGQTTFALPDFRGRVPLGPGKGPGLSQYDPGQTGGTEVVTLNINEMPLHTHGAKSSGTMSCYSGPGGDTSPKNNFLAEAEGNIYSDVENANMAAGGVAVETTIDMAGGSAPHNNIQPFLSINFIIAIEGDFPKQG